MVRQYGRGGGRWGGAKDWGEAGSSGELEVRLDFCDDIRGNRVLYTLSRVWRLAGWCVHGIDWRMGKRSGNMRGFGRDSVPRYRLYCTVQYTRTVCSQTCGREMDVFCRRQTSPRATTAAGVSVVGGGPAESVVPRWVGRPAARRR